LKESFAVVSGRHSLEKLQATLLANDSVVIMKAGLSRQRILDALSATGRTGEAKYLEYIGREAQHIETDVSALAGEAGPYFSLFVVTKAERGSR
jgi:precorrin-2/cobalt-factor-2 C20-methyltransferase